MVYLIRGYNAIQCENVEEAERKAEEYVKSEGLSYEKVLVGTKEYSYGENGGADGGKVGFVVETIVYQYHTLYFETFVITPRLDVFDFARNERICKEEGKND